MAKASTKTAAKTKTATADTTATATAPKTTARTAKAEDPNATPRERRDALNAQFAAADADEQAAIIEQTRTRNAALGY